MIKHTVTMDKDDLKRIEDSLSAIREALRILDESDAKDQIAIDVGIIEDILGIEPPPIPEAVTARWSVWYNAMFRSATLTCSHCGYKHDTAIDTSDSPSGMPTICPQCKAVMTGVE